jgi:multimeric flavodoxin WrbA
MPQVVIENPVINSPFAEPRRHFKFSDEGVHSMKALAINGSPRQGGNTEYLLRKVLEPICEAGIETELIKIGGRQVRGCSGCYKCMENQDSRCSNKTDFVNECIGKMIEADAIILGSPTYFADMTSEMKALIDRVGMVARANGHFFSRKIGAAVVTCRRGGAVNVLDSINHMYLISRMIVPGSTYWNFGLGDVEQDAEALANMKDLGETIAWLIKSLKA